MMHHPVKAHMVHLQPFYRPFLILWIVADSSKVRILRLGVRRADIVVVGMSRSGFRSQNGSPYSLSDGYSSADF